MRKFEKMKAMAQMASVFSAINGGIIGTIKKLEQLDDCLKLCIHLPGINVNSIRAEIKNNYLTVQYFIEMNTEKIKSKVGNIVHTQALPYFIDVNKVSAHFSEGKLDITMPFNDLANGYNTRLDIGS